MRSHDDPQLKQTNKPLNNILRFFCSTKRLALLFYTYVVFHFAKQFCAVDPNLRRTVIGRYWTVSARQIPWTDTDCFCACGSRHSSYRRCSWNNFVFIQCLPYPPPSLPDMLRHPAIHLLPAHHNSNVVRNVVLSVRPSHATLPLCDLLNVGDRNFIWIFKEPSGLYTYHQFNIHELYVLPTPCIYVFYVDLRTNNDFPPKQPYITGFVTQTQCFYWAVLIGCT